jgi:DNA polymerase-3 subunit beta
LKTAGKLFKSSFSTLSAKDFPVIDVVQEDVDSLTINAKSLLRLLSATEYAMFSGDGRYNMSCISLTASGGLLTAAAIDGHRFSIAREPVDNNSTMRIIVPSKSIYEIIKILKDPKYSSLDIKLQSDGRRISIAIGDVVMISRLVDAVFPEYESLIPTDFSSKLSIHTNVLYEIVDRVSAITVEDSRDIRFILSPNVIEVSGYGESKGAANEVLNNDDGAKFLYDGAEITFAVNAKYLTDVLRSMDEQEIEICFDKPNFPFVIKPSINTQDIFVIMPLDI